jgi:hypothetical protein
MQRVSFLTPKGGEKFFRAGGPEITGRQWDRDRSPVPSHKIPVAVLRMKIGVKLWPGRAGGWSRPMRRKRNERKFFKIENEVQMFSLSARQGLAGEHGHVSGLRSTLIMYLKI